jgi:hypothetical protein
MAHLEKGGAQIAFIKIKWSLNYRTDFNLELVCSSIKYIAISFIFLR